MTGDNLDLAVRRKRLRLTQQDVAVRLGITNGSSISRFETMASRLPAGKKREDYEALLDRLERTARKAS